MRAVLDPGSVVSRGAWIALFLCGHAIFSVQGIARWRADVLEFLGRYLGKP